MYPFGSAAVLVVCPRCSQRATVVPAEGERRLVCGACGLAQTRAGRRSIWGPPLDPWFEQPLWLTERFGEHIVWAFNREHAELLRDFVAAKHRERQVPRTHASMVEKLPRWFKARANRDAITAILDRLVDRAERSTVDGS